MSDMKTISVVKGAGREIVLLYDTTGIYFNISLLDEDGRPTEGFSSSGLWREDVNELIRNLRVARDLVFGADE